MCGTPARPRFTSSFPINECRSWWRPEVELINYKCWRAVQILCARCLIPVQIKGFAQRDDGKLFAFVKCHGDKDTVEIRGEAHELLSMLLPLGDRFREMWREN